MNKTLKRKSSLSLTSSPKSPKSPKKTKKSSFSIIPSEGELQHVIPFQGESPYRIIPSEGESPKRIIPSQGESPKRIIPSEGESEYEAYHSVFSWLSGTNIIFKKLAINCGATKLDNIKKYSNKYEKFQTDKEFLPNNIVSFSEKIDKVTNYHYVYKDKDGTVHDPYSYFQLYNTQGNCFLFALYLCYVYNKKNLQLLINVRPLLEIVEGKGKDDEGKKLTYSRVNPQDKQLAYTCFVYNDYQIIQWAIDHLMSHELLQIYNDEWNKLYDEDKDKNDIPLNKNYTFDVFYEQFVRLARDRSETYKMTWDQVCNWDDERQKDVFPEHNSGIENSLDIDKNQYMVDMKNLTKNKLLKKGGRTR